MHILRGRRLVAGALAVGLAVACRSPAEPQGTVTAAFEGPAVRITNQTRHRIFYEATEGDAVRLGIWVPCDDPDTCASIAAGRSILLPLSEVHGVDGPTDVVRVLWWRLVAEVGGTEYRLAELDLVYARR